MISNVGQQTVQGTPTVYSDGFRPLGPFSSCLVHPGDVCVKRTLAGLGEKTTAKHRDGVI
jgi:hypothetical protein